LFVNILGYCMFVPLYYLDNKELVVEWEGGQRSLFTQLLQDFVAICGIFEITLHERT